MTLTTNSALSRDNQVRWRDIFRSTPFFLVHFACLGALWTGVDLTAALMCAGLFLIRKFGITGGYHRYFSHRSFKTGRVMQFVLAWLGCASTQKGPLWWASHHRSHHQDSDGESDVHSPVRDGFWWSHVGWILSDKYNSTDFRIIPDFARFPELRWLNRFHLVPPVSLAVACLAFHGWSGLVWGYFISTVILWHTTFFINSLCHLFGRRYFPTKDTSRNSLLLALVTLGEGWHNNHHYYPSSVNQGFYWWEIDITYYVLRLMSGLGLVWDLRRPPARVLALGREVRRRAKRPAAAMESARIPAWES
jgi:stearoyl-CoA desaturase (Delta-9 desaturase)